jgi:predicted phosphodiesterase
VRYGVLADIHGNLTALRAAMEVLRERDVERWLVAGDVVGYGAEPNECIAAATELEATAVKGNHDLIALGELSDQRCIAIARESLRWTRNALSAESRAWLEALPVKVQVPGGIVMAHGSLSDPQEYTLTRGQALSQLREVEADGARILVLGHTHRPWAFSRSTGPRLRRQPLRLPADEATLLNPGAVGQSRQLLVRARALLLDTDAGVAEFLAVPYDVATARATLRRAGLSEGGVHLRPSVPGVVRRGLRAALYRAMARAGR